jgi:GNAT superfamily N-acetyltransferase
MIDLAEQAFEIVALTPGRAEAWLRFFDHDAFADHPAWQFCYCQFLQVDHRVVVWRERSATTNRDAAALRIGEGGQQGWLAMAQGRVVGWCNAAPRDNFAALDDEPDADSARIGRIACFVVAPAWRRRGIARALLDAACDGFRSAGLAWAEALALAGEGSAAQNHFGPLAMFLAAGFKVHRPADADGDRLTLRRRLDTGADTA